MRTRLLLPVILLAVAGNAVGAAPSAPAPVLPATAVVVFPTILQIHFSGNQKLSTAQLLQAVGIKIGDAHTDHVVGDAMQNIVNAYQAAGIELALRVDIKRPDAAHTEITFLIDERAGRIATPRSGARIGIPAPPSPATRQ